MSSAPTGRGELLSWANAACETSYPRVEDLCDGIVYLQLLEMALPEAPAFLHRAASFTCLPTSKAAGGATAGTSIIHRGEREKNFHLFQEIVRHYVPQKRAIEIDVPRLADGKLQDHMTLLRWVNAFVGRAVSLGTLRFSSEPASRRADAAGNRPLCSYLGCGPSPRVAARLVPSGGREGGGVQDPPWMDAASSQQQQDGSASSSSVYDAARYAAPPSMIMHPQGAWSRPGVGGVASSSGVTAVPWSDDRRDGSSMSKTASSRFSRPPQKVLPRVLELLDQLTSALNEKAVKLEGDKSNLSSIQAHRDALAEQLHELCLSVDERASKRDQSEPPSASPADDPSDAALVEAECTMMLLARHSTTGGGTREGGGGGIFEGMSPEDVQAFDDAAKYFTPHHVAAAL